MQGQGLHWPWEWSGVSRGAGPVQDGGLIVLAEDVLRLMAEWLSPDASALLLIEDLQWADRETLEVIEHLADHLSGQPVLVVATLRDDEPGPGGELVWVLRARRAVQPISLSPARGGPGRGDVAGSTGARFRCCPKSPMPWWREAMACRSSSRTAGDRAEQDGCRTGCSGVHRRGRRDSPAAAHRRRRYSDVPVPPSADC